MPHVIRFKPSDDLNHLIRDPYADGVMYGRP